MNRVQLQENYVNALLTSNGSDIKPMKASKFFTALATTFGEANVVAVFERILDAKNLSYQKGIDDFKKRISIAINEDKNISGPDQVYLAAFVRDRSINKGLNN